MNLVAATEKILYQLDHVLDQVRPDDYRRPSKLLSNSSIGQHVRHTIEFFLCLRDGVGAGFVNYDDRKRDIALETDCHFARDLLAEIIRFVNTQKTNTPLQLQANFGEEEAAASVPSCYYRELVYNIEHAIHHMALMRVALNEACHYVALPEDFGVASSTMRSKASIK